MLSQVYRCLSKGIATDRTLRLVRESCCGTLSWVECGKLERWPGRDEWEHAK
jgi:hypothetical protein